MAFTYGSDDVTLPIKCIADELKLILFCHARSGSSSLFQILQLHPQLNILEEPFNERFNVWYPDEKNYLNLIKDRASLDEQLSEIFSKYNGIKVLQYQLPEDLYRYMLLKPECRVIFLRRMNLLQAVVSGLIAVQTQLWKRWEMDRPIDKIYANLKPLSIEDIQERIKYLHKNLDMFEEVILSRPVGTYLRLIYEDLYFSLPEQRQAYLERIFRFLEFDMIDNDTVQQYLDPKKAKINSPETYMFIPNVIEINERLGNDEIGWLLEIR